MFDVEIKIKRIDEDGTYYVIVPIGDFADKLEFCQHFIDKTDEEVLTYAKPILNDVSSEIQ
jgi:hypothetical protein